VLRALVAVGWLQVVGRLCGFYLAVSEFMLSPQCKIHTKFGEYWSSSSKGNTGYIWQGGVVFWGVGVEEHGKSSVSLQEENQASIGMNGRVGAWCIVRWCR
jgi:hypothetical protein